MNLPDIGHRCEAYLCGDRDFLPIQCPGCQATFCRHHSSLDAHACPSLAAKTDITHPPAPRRARCAVETCQKLTMESNIVDTAHSEPGVVALCPNCSQAFCPVHRHPPDHDCSMIPKATSASQKNPEAHQLLAKHFPPNRLASSSTGSSVDAKPPTDPKKVARLRAVELMKMRHQAIPADPKDKSVSASPNERIHVKIRVNSSPPSADKLFWLRKSIGTGRALDMIAEQLSINISDTNPASFKKISQREGEDIVLRNDVLISKQVEDGDLLILVTKTTV